MSIQGIIVLILIGIAFLFWILNLVRSGRLYVGYGVIFVMIILAVIAILAVPRMLTLVTHMVGAVFPASALTLLALCFIVLLLVYILSQVTIISNRVATLAQELAIREARDDAIPQTHHDGQEVNKKLSSELETQPRRA
jgi:hypothetical protein